VADADLEQTYQDLGAEFPIMALSKASSPNATAPLEYLRKEGGFVGLVNE